MLIILLSLAVICNYGLAQITLVNPLAATASDVTFHLATQSQPDPVLITSTNSTVLLDVTKPIRFIIHGYRESYQVPWMVAISNEYLATYDFNIILVDWSRPAGLDYYTAAESVDVVGKTVSQFILDTGLTPGDLTIVGHSLGAQAAGFVGQYLIAAGQLLGRIIGTEPAGPLFREATKTDADRLSKDDALVVVGHHTDAGFFGYENPVGTLDIYLNGGSRIQPGCIEQALELSAVDTTAACSHTRSHIYLTDSIRTGKYQCQFCDPPTGTYTYGGVCNDNGQRASYNSEDFTASTTGICFATTNSAAPYLS